MSKIAASFSSWGKTCWRAKFLLNLTVKSSKAPNLFLYLAPSLRFFFICCAPSVLDFIPLLCNVFPFFTWDFSASTGFVPLAVAAAAMARRTFLCRIPQALQSDCHTKMNFQYHLVSSYFLSIGIEDSSRVYHNSCTLFNQLI